MDEFWNLRALHYFVVTAEYKNMTQAANALFLTQPALSHQIQKIETDLNITLFNRVKKGLELTLKGQEFYKECKKLLTAHQEFNTAVYGLSHTEVGNLKIAYPKCAERFLMLANKEYLQQYPNIRIRTIRQGNVPFLRLLENRDIDLAYMHKEDLEYAGTSVRSHFLFSLDYNLLVNCQGPLADRESVDFSELGDMYFVLPDRRIHASKVGNVVKYAHQNGYNPKIRQYHFGLDDYIMEIMTYPDSVAILPYIEAIREERAGFVKYIKLTGFLPVDDIYMAWDEETNNSLVRSYIEFVKKNQGRYPVYASPEAAGDRRIG